MDDQEAIQRTPLTPLDEDDCVHVHTYSKKFLVDIDEACRSTRMRLALLLALEEGDYLEDAERNLLQAADKVLLRISRQAREERSLYMGGR